MPLPPMHLSYDSGCLRIGLCVINTHLDVQIYAQMENIKLAGKAPPPNTGVQWNSPLFSLWNMNVSLNAGRLGNSCP